VEEFSLSLQVYFERTPQPRNVTFWQSVPALENQFQYRSVRKGLRKLTVNKKIRKDGEERAVVYLQEPVTLISQDPASYANTKRYIIQFWSDCIGFRMAKPW